MNNNQCMLYCTAEEEHD